MVEMEDCHVLSFVRKTHQCTRVIGFITKCEMEIPKTSEEIGMKCVHVVDSQVVLAVVVKGRSSSLQLNRVLKKLNCLLIASGMKLCLAYVSTDQNPADRPSRWRHEKHKYKIYGEKGNIKLGRQEGKGTTKIRNWQLERKPHTTTDTQSL